MHCKQRIKRTELKSVSKLGHERALTIFHAVIQNHKFNFKIYSLKLMFLIFIIFIQGTDTVLIFFLEIAIFLYIQI